MDEYNGNLTAIKIEISNINSEIKTIKGMLVTLLRTSMPDKLSTLHHNTSL
jgi:hypothetical protein